MQIPLHERSPVQQGQALRALVWDRDLVDMWVLDAAGRRRPFQGRGSTWHVHPDAELTVLTQGEGLLSVGDSISRFTAPDCILLGPGLPHVWKADGPIAGVSVQFRIDPTAPLSALPEWSQFDRLWAQARYGLRWQGKTGQRIGDQLRGMHGQSALRRLGIFLDCMATLRESCASEGQRLSQSLVVHGQAERHGEAMARVVDFVMQHYRDELSLARAVAISGMSQATFCRHFTKLTGKTFVAYVHAIRMQEVCRALVESDDSITDIAFASGFSNLSHFNAVFRKHQRCTPQAFRRRSKG